MLHYFYMTAAGKLSGLSADAVAEQFPRMLADPGVMMFWMVLVVIIGIVVCAGGLQNGLELSLIHILSDRLVSPSVMRSLPGTSLSVPESLNRWSWSSSVSRVPTLSGSSTGEPSAITGC